MSATKRVFRLGRQVVPAFAGRATLMQSAMFFGEESNPASPFNVACLAFYSRRGGRSADSPFRPAGAPIAYSFWANRILSDGVRNLFGVSQVLVPPYSEYFSVSWVAPPASVLTPASDPFYAPEWYFSIRWDLVT